MRQVIKPLDFIEGEGTRTDQAHLAAQDVDQLGKFIETEFADEPSNSGDAGVVGQFEDRAGHFIEDFQFVFALGRVGNHGAEFEHGERFSIQARPLLSEQDRAV